MSQFLDVSEAASIIKIHPTTLRVWLRSGKVRGLKFGSIWRTTLEWLNEFGNKTSIQQPATPSQDEQKARYEAAQARIRAKYK